MKKIAYISAFVILFTATYAQDDFSSLDISFDYFSNTNTFGQFNSITKQPYYSPAISYFDKSGIMLSVMSNFIENSDTSLEEMTTEIDVNFGYDWKIGKHISVFPSYTRYFYIGESNSLKSSFSDNLTLDASLDIANIYTGANASYLFGDENELFLSAYVSYAVTMEDFPFKNSFFILQPEVNFNFGNQTYYDNYLWNNWQNDQDFRNNVLESRKFQRLLRLLRRNNPELSEDELFALLVIRQTETNNEFNLSTIGATLPVSYIIGNFSINGSFSTYFLINKPEYVEEDYQTYFSLGLSYSFMWE